MRTLAVVLLVCVAVLLRFQALDEWRAKPLDPDVQDYKAIALEMRHPYDTQYREPVQPWLIWLFLKLFGTSDLAPRVATFIVSILILLLSLIIWARAAENWRVGYLAALLFAINGSLVEMSVKGYRMEVYTLLLILFFGLFLKIFHPSAPACLVWMGIIGALLCLTIFASATVVIPLIARSILRDRAPWKFKLLTVALMVALVTPHLVYNYQEFGDPLHSTNQHAVFYRNQEFADRPGFPTREEIRKDAYAGKKVTATQYIFGMHTPLEVAGYTASGSIQLLTLYVSPLLPFGNKLHQNLKVSGIVGKRGLVGKILKQVLAKDFLLKVGIYAALHASLMALWLVGFVLMLKQKTLLSVLWLSTLIPYVFIAGAVAIDWRLAAHFQVFANGCAAVAGYRLSHGLHRLTQVGVNLTGEGPRK